MEQEKPDIHICITEGVSKTARILIYQIAGAELFREKRVFKLYLTDKKQNFDTLERIVKEFQLSGLPYVKNISFLNIKDAFEIADILILLHPERGRCGPDPYDYLQPYVEIFKEHGLALALFAKQTARVVVAGDMANTHARVLLEYAKMFPVNGISVVTRLHANYGRAVLAEKLEVKTSSVRDVLVTGNCTGVQHINALPGRLVKSAATKAANEVRLTDALAHDHKWLRKDFVKLTKDAGVATVNVHLPDNSFSLATAIFDHVCELWQGTPDDCASSAGIYLDCPLGGMKPDIYISLPVRASGQTWFLDFNYILDMGCLKETIKDAAVQLHAELAAALKILAERKYAKEHPPRKKSSSLLNISEVFRWLEDLIEKATISIEDIPSVEEFAEKYLGSLEAMVDGGSRTSIMSPSERKGSLASMTTESKTMSSKTSRDSMLQNILKSISKEDNSLKMIIEENGKGLVKGKRSGSIVTSKEKYKDSGEYVDRKSRPSVTIVDDRIEKTLAGAASPDQKASNELINRSSKPSVRMLDSKEDNKMRSSSETIDRKTSLKSKPSVQIADDKEGKRGSVESTKRKLSVKIVDSKEMPISTSAEKVVRGSKESVKKTSKTSLKRESSGNLAK